VRMVRDLRLRPESLIFSKRMGPPLGGPRHLRYAALRAGPAISLQESAQRRQTSAQRCMNSSDPSPSQLSAQRSHTSAHSSHARGCWSEPRSMKWALVSQISAQSCSSETCRGSACLPPFSRQCETVSMHTDEHSKHTWIHCRILSETCGINSPLGFCFPWTISSDTACALDVAPGRTKDKTLRHVADSNPRGVACNRELGSKDCDICGRPADGQQFVRHQLRSSLCQIDRPDWPPQHGYTQAKRPNPYQRDS
jgi:hypothetical protein